MENFTATIEYVGRKAAIITLTNSLGEWSGSSRIDITHGSKSALYELGYARANQSATLKGGTLNTYSVLK